MEVKIVSTVEYATRRLAMVDIRNSHGTFRTYFYRSTGSNVAGKGMWFPFGGLAGPGAMKRTGMHAGWLIKDLVFATPETIKMIPTWIDNEVDHANPEARLHAHLDASLKFEVKEVSNIIQKMHEEDEPMPIAAIDFPAEAEDILYVNTWVVKGLRTMYPPESKNEEGEQP